MRIIITLLLLCNLTFGENTNLQPSNKSRLANKVRKKTAAYLQKKENLIFFGDGSRMMDQIKMLALSFNYRKSIDIKKGRELLILATNRFLEEINNEKAIHPYLQQYPFKAKNIEIKIFLQKPNGGDLPEGSLTVISIINGILKYKIESPKTHLLHTIYQETYGDAVKKIAKANGTLSKEDEATFDEIDDEDSFANRSIGASFKPDLMGQLHNHAKKPSEKKWLLTFKKILGKPPYKLQTSRVSQFYDIFRDDPIVSSNLILRGSLSKNPFCFSVDETGYLPGERVTFRICSSKPTLFTQITGCPRPLTIFKKTGETLLDAELVRVKPAIYHITVSSISEKEKFKLIFKSGDIKKEYCLQGPLEKQFSPEIKESNGGIGQVELLFGDKTSYKLELPWGDELLKYKKM